MGLSALQARLLMIVSRMNDVGAEQASISQAQLELATESEQIAKKHSDAMSNTKLVINVESDEGDSFSIEKKDLDYKTMCEQGILSVTKEDEILLQKDANGNWIIPKDKDGNTLIEVDEATGKATILKEEPGDGGTKKQYNLKDGSKYLNDATSINTALSYGALYLLDTNNLGSGLISPMSLSVDSNIVSVMDTSDDAAAESEYEYETSRIKRLETQYDMEMKKLDTEATALNKEYESITKAIESNVNRTFNLFQNG